jgi:hypothetical protein
LPASSFTSWAWKTGEAGSEAIPGISILVGSKIRSGVMIEEEIKKLHSLCFHYNEVLLQRITKIEACVNDLDGLLISLLA